MISSNALPSASPGAQDPSNAPYSSGRVYDMTNRWRPTEGAAESLLFDGAPKLVELLEELIQRPRSWRREHLLPIVYLILPDQDTPLHGIDDRFRQSARIISSRVGADPTDADDTASGILGLLNQIVADLSSATKGTGRLKFPHYSPAVWLHGLTMDGTNDQPDQLDKLVYLEFKNFIRRRYPVVSQAGGTADPVDQFPAYIRAITRAIPPLAVALMRAFWRPPRWIARRHEVGRSHGQPSFMQLARTFMERTVRPSVRAPISANKIDQLLVDAFLEDLWRSYRRYTVFGQGRRRMSYPVALIEDGRAGSAGLELLRFIAISRDRAGLRSRRPRPFRPDPLLLVAGGNDSGYTTIRAAFEAGQRELSVADASYAYEHLWLGEMERAGRYRTWFLPLTIPRSDAGTPGAYDRIIGIRLRPPRRPLLLAIAMALMATGAVSVGYDTYYHHCGTWQWESRLTKYTAENNAQCIGLAPAGYRFFANIPTAIGVDAELAQQLRDVEENIHHTNTEVTRTGRHLTIVYLSTLTPGDVEGLQSELENLRGIEVAQSEAKSYLPVRVLLANAGAGMDHGRAAAESIARAASRDKTLVAVVGMGISREGTRQAMLRLDQARIPIIGTTISATDLAENTTPYYHQAGPTNKREATVSAHYAAKVLKAKHAVIYYLGDEDDLYSTDLRTQAQAAFTKEGMSTEEHPYKGKTGVDVSMLGRHACSIGRDAVAFYAGRAEGLNGFLSGLRNTCNGNFPKIISGDDATRFMLTGKLAIIPGLPLYYVSFGSSLAWGPECKDTPRQVGFYVGYLKHYGNACPNTWDGNAIMAYDSFHLFDQAVQNAPRDVKGAPSAEGVLFGLAKIGGNGSLSGASGRIDFGTSGRSVPINKAVLILIADGANQPALTLLCGDLVTTGKQPDYDKCPDPEPVS